MWPLLVLQLKYASLRKRKEKEGYENGDEEGI